MIGNFADITAFVAVAHAGGFREAARTSGGSASTLSESVRRLETELGIRLLNRTTRSVAVTEAGARLLDRLGPALSDLETALDAVNDYRDSPSGTLKLNVPLNAARLIMPRILPPFLAAHPDIRVEIVADEGFVDLLAAGCDAGIRYDDRLEQDMIAVPIGPRKQRFATAASPEYLRQHGHPEHPSDLLHHACIRGRFRSGALSPWEFEREGELIRVEPNGPLIVSSNAIDLSIDAAIAGLGIGHLFEDWVKPHLDSGKLEPVLQPWWQEFSGPYLYYPGRRYVPAPLRAFIDFINARSDTAGAKSIR